jgi:hypothetical protein
VPLTLQLIIPTLSDMLYTPLQELTLGIEIVTTATECDTVIGMVSQVEPTCLMDDMVSVCSGCHSALRQASLTHPVVTLEDYPGPEFR